MNQHAKKRIIVLGYSHARGCAWELQLNMKKDWIVEGVSKPGAVTKQVIENSVKLCSNLSDKDFVMLWTGTNDVARNETINFICRL